MIAFGVGAGLLLLAALWFTVLGQGRHGKQSPAALAHLQPYRERQAELERERELGNLDPIAYEQLRLELQRRLVAEHPATPESLPGRTGRSRVWLLMTGLLPVAGLALYTSHSSLHGWQIQKLLERSRSEARAGVDNSATVAQLSRELQDYVEAGRDRERGRYVLAQLEMERGNVAAAAQHYGHLADLEPDDPDLQAQAAQAEYLAGGQRLTTTIRRRVALALAQNPQQPTALGLAGIDAYEQQRYAAALSHWQQLLAQLPAGAPGADVIERGVEHARARLGAAATEQSGAQIRVEVALGEGLEAGGTLFVFARVPGERMPLAAVRVDQPRFPMQVRLSDANAMNPGRSLAQAEQVEIVARLSRSGEVSASAGDAQAVSAPLRLGDSDDKVLLELTPQGPEA